MTKFRARGHKNGPSKEFLDAIDNKDFVTIHECLEKDGFRNIKWVENLSKVKFYLFWECIVKVAITLPPLNKPLALSTPATESSRNSLNSATSLTSERSSESMEVVEHSQETLSIKDLPEDKEELTKMVIKLVGLAISQFASKNKEPFNLSAVLPLLKHLLQRNCFIPEITSISEQIWHRRWTGYEVLAGPSLKLLLRKVLSDNATKKDVKNVTHYKDLIDDSLDWFEEIKPQLIECLITKKFLSETTSMSFLAQLFKLTPQITIECFEAMKADLIKPGTTRFKAQCYGKILGLALQVEDDKLKEVLKDKCIQFIIWKFLRLQWSSDLRHLSPLGMLLFDLLLEVNYIAKKHPAVLTLLMDAYDPLLWRHLVISNNNYRANAARILFDLFPLERPGAGHVENEKLLFMQYNLIVGLLEDDSDLVRVIATKEVCKILASFWACLPTKFRADTTHCIMTKLCFDQASIEVRKQSLLGLAHAIKNGPYSMCKYIGPRLKQLCMLVYDESKVVCRAMLKVLLALQELPRPNENGMVDTVPSCWAVVPPKMIVNLLGGEDQEAPIMSTLVQLLHSSLHPSDPIMLRERSVVKRVSWIIKLDINAARNFYHNSAHVLSEKEAIRFMQKVLLVLAKYCSRSKPKFHEKFKRSLLENKENSNSENTQNSQESEVSSLDESDGTLGSSSSETQLSPGDPSITAGLLDIVVILWLKHQETFMKEQNSEHAHKLMIVAKDALQCIFKYWKDEQEVMHPLLLLASLLPKKKVRILVSYSHSQLKILASRNGPLPKNFANLLLTVLCNWNCGEELLEMIGDSLHEVLEKARNDHPRAKKKKVRAVVFEAEEKLRPEVMLEYLHLLFVHPINHDYIAEKVQLSMQELLHKLETIKVIIEYRMEKITLSISDDLIHLMLLRYVKLIGLIRSKKNHPFDFSTVYIEILQWAEEIILPYCDRQCLDKEESQPNRLPMPALLLLDILRGATYVIHLDKATSELCQRVVMFCNACLDTDVATYLVPGILCVSAALQHHGVCVTLGNRDGTVPDGLVDTLVPSVVQKTLSHCNNEKIALSLNEDQDSNELEINIDMLLNAFLRKPESYEQVFELCTSFIRAILKITMCVKNEKSPDEIPQAANYLLTTFLNSSVDSSLLAKPLLTLIHSEFGSTYEEHEAVAKLITTLSNPRWAGVISSHYLNKCLQVLESCTPLEDSMTPED